MSSTVPDDRPAGGDRALFDSAPCGLVRTAADGSILLANRQFCEWLGYAHEELAGRRRLQDLMTVGGRIFHHTHLSPLLQMQGTVSELKLDFVRADGQHVPMVVNAARRTESGHVYHDVATYVARDRDTYEKELVRARKRLETTLAAATRLEAESRDHALAAEQMIGIVSHDLRNPLSSIALGAALLGRHELPESQRRTLRRITRAAERATELISDLLDFTQAGLGRGLSVALAPCDLPQLIAQAIDELGAVYPGRELVHLHRGPRTCLADPKRLAQLLGNLVSNAMTYGLPDEPVSVSSAIEDGRCSVAVHNQGPPIPPELLARIFEPMTRGTEASSSARSVGLGLFIVRKIVEAHGGEVAVTSGSAGTTFTATFPARADAARDPPVSKLP